MGIACDNMLSAKIILANGRLVIVDEEHDPDLFWAIKGAGYYFGLVLEITMKIYPLSIFGTPEGQHWTGNYVYPIERAPEVFNVVESLAATSESQTAGLVMFVAPPPQRKPMIVVAPHYFGSLEDGPKRFQELSQLEPLMYSEKAPHVPNLSDHLDFACGKGGLRRFKLTGLQELKIENCLQLTKIFQQLVESCPDAPRDRPPLAESSLPKVFEFEGRAIDAMRQGTKPESYIDLPHGTRTHPIERRFPDKDTLAKLRALKKQFDPQGTFTGELL
ncbi:MAG: hypothetical protein Q9212_004356 [Teloschistes hypoglaucus]